MHALKKTHTNGERGGCPEEGLWKHPVSEERKGLICEMTYKLHLLAFYIKPIRTNINLLIHL